MLEVGIDRGQVGGRIRPGRPQVVGSPVLGNESVCAEIQPTKGVAYGNGAIRQEIVAGGQGCRRRQRFACPVGFDQPLDLRRRLHQPSNGQLRHPQHLPACQQPLTWRRAIEVIGENVALVKSSKERPPPCLQITLIRSFVGDRGLVGQATERDLLIATHQHNVGDGGVGSQRRADDLVPDRFGDLVGLPDRAVLAVPRSVGAGDDRIGVHRYHQPLHAVQVGQPPQRVRESVGGSDTIGPIQPGLVVENERLRTGRADRRTCIGLRGLRVHVGGRRPRTGLRPSQRGCLHPQPVGPRRVLAVGGEDQRVVPARLKSDGACKFVISSVVCRYRGPLPNRSPLANRGPLAN